MIKPYLDFHRDQGTGKITEYSLHGLNRKHVAALYFSLLLAKATYTKFDGIYLREMFAPHSRPANHQELCDAVVHANSELLKILNVNLGAQIIKTSDFNKN